MDESKIYADLKRVVFAMCDLYGVQKISFEVDANKMKDSVTVKMDKVISL